MEDNYDDIIQLPHHVSSVHPHMSIHDRAAQFAPFAALTGHGTAIAETARLTDEKLELDESQKMVLDQKLLNIMHNADKKCVSIEYFVRMTEKPVEDTNMCRDIYAMLTYMGKDSYGRQNRDTDR